MAARTSLAEHFGLPYSQHMQDWEWEVADSERIDEFMDAYLNEDLSDDERFTLMEMLLQSFEDLDDLEAHPRWEQMLSLLDEHIELHAYSVWYWARPDYVNEDEVWAVTPALRRILEKHRSFLSPSP